MDTNMVKKKTTQGRRKIEIKKIEKNNSRQVTFSKRRGGLFKKASELCVLTGAEIAIMVHSPGGRVFAFGHPSPDHVVNRYLSTSGNLGSKQTTKLADPKPIMSDFNQHYAEISKELEEEKKKKDVIDQSNNMVNNGMFWWDEPIDGLTLEELEQFVASLEELKNKVVTRVDELTMIRSSSLSSISSTKSLLDVNQTPKNDVGEFGDYQNMEYGGSTNSLVPLGLDFGSGNIGS